MKSQTVTNQLYTTLDDAYCFFNDMLFENQLPNVVMVLQRKGKKNLGYFHAERYASRQDMKSKKSKKSVQRVSELSLNPDNFMWQSDKEILSVLVHEMVHVWQFYFDQKAIAKRKEGKSQNGYHDKIWGSKMKEIGLYPSNTGEKDGKETGQQMHHYIIKGGKFDLHVESFLKSGSFHWNSLPIASKSSTKKNKTTYQCPGCEVKIWGKPGIHVECSDCGEQFEEV